MKRLVCVLVMVSFMVISCGHPKTPVITKYPTIEEVKWRRKSFASMSHWTYSQWGYWDGTQQEELDKAMEQEWFGELVPQTEEVLEGEE